MHAIVHGLSAAALCALLAVPCVAHAAPVTLNLTGITTQAVFDPFDPLNGAVQSGSPMYAYLNFDSAAADAAPEPGIGSYTVSGGTYGLAAFLGNVLFPVMRTVNLTIVDGAAGGPDLLTLFASEGVQDGLSDYFSMSVLLEDDSGTAFSSDVLDWAALDLGRFNAGSFGLTGQFTNLDGVFVQYEALGAMALPVPEPGTLALLAAAGLAALSRRTGRRRT